MFGEYQGKSFCVKHQRRGLKAGIIMAIEGISQDRIAKVFQVNAYLMGSSGFWTEEKKRVIPP